MAYCGAILVDEPEYPDDETALRASGHKITFRYCRRMIRDEATEVRRSLSVLVPVVVVGLRAAGVRVEGV